jgi:cytochrome d ubiquinol oxidase subunit I
MHGLNTLEHQPAKVAAMEGIWETERGASLTLFGIPDQEARTTHYALKIPKVASLILTHELDGEVKGINEFEGAHPPVAPVFYAFRLMVGVGSLMLLVAGFTAWRLWLQRRQSEVVLPKPLLWLLSGMAFSGWVATLAGWYVTEIGRQPFLVYGLMRTSEAATTLPPPYIALTLTAYLVVYGLLLVTYVGVLKYMAEHPKEHRQEAPTGALLGKAGV